MRAPRMRPPFAALLALATLQRLAAQTPDTLRTARVTYVTPSSAYIDAGRDQGVREGAAVEVIRGGHAIATLAVTYLASSRAACAIVTASAAIVEGDTVRYHPAAPSDARGDSASPTQVAATPSADRRAGWSGGGIRGRLGLRYLAARQQGTPGSRYAEPALDVRIDGRPVGTAPVDVALDVRARRLSSQWADGSRDETSRTRVYQAVATWKPASAPVRLSVGRLYTPTASLSLLDGAMLQLEHPTWNAGILTGSEPGAIDLALSSEIRDYGAFAEVRAPPSAGARWAVAAGAIGSYQADATNREFAFLHARYLARRISAVVTQELDYYRPWKVAAGEPAFSPTSTFATLDYRFGDAWHLNAGFDNRRTVRLYRDMTTPETAFDDSFRRGGWAGVSGRLIRDVRFSLDARLSDGANGAAAAYTAFVSADRVPVLGAGFRLRTTRYTNPYLTGWLHSLALGGQPLAPLHVEVTGGLRRERNPLDVPADLHAVWVGADVDLGVARSWYVTLSVNAERGASVGDDRIYGGVTYRF